MLAYILLFTYKNILQCIIFHKRDLTGLKIRIMNEIGESQGATAPEGKKQKRTVCPFVRSPSRDCYFLDMNSNKISMAVYYCQNHYDQCEIYKRIKKHKKE